MQIMNTTQNTLLVRHADTAFTFFSRLKGLLGKKRLLEGEGLIIRPCNSVHTFGMNFAIDIAFVDKDHQVLKTVACLTPGKTAMCRPASYVVELPAGKLEKTNTIAGDRLLISE